MGISSYSTSPSEMVIPESKIKLPRLSPEEEIFSFSDGCCTGCVGVVDIINSTKITASLCREKMSRYYYLFLNSVAAVVKGYGGNVVKNTGDGILYYFPQSEESSSPRMIRSCLNCSLSLTQLHSSINRKFTAEMLPQLNYRISLDYGEVMLARTNRSDVQDIFGSTVNVCAKINSLAAPNTVVAGGDLYQVAKGISGYCFRDAKKSLSIDSKPYPVYAVTEGQIPTGLRMTIFGWL